MGSRNEKVEVRKVLSGRAIVNLQKLVSSVAVSEYVVKYVSRLVRATRPRDETAPEFVRELVDWGAGPRAGLFLINGGKALAAMDGRFSVAIDDVRRIAIPVLRHRVSTNFQAQAEGMTTEDIIRAAAQGDPRTGSSQVRRTAERRNAVRTAWPVARRLPPIASRTVMSSVEKYLKPEVINQIKRLDLRAQFVVRGFLQGLHASPFHGFSVEFSEHRKYTSGDDPKDIDWLVFAKTDKFYVKKFEAETNITGYLVMDLSRSMGYTYRQDLSKFDYAICLAASLCYLMIHQQDPVGLITFDQRVRQSLAPRSKRTHLGNVLSHLSRLQPAGRDGHIAQPDSDRGDAAASQPGDDLLRSAGRHRSRSFGRCGNCGTAVTT